MCPRSSTAGSTPARCPLHSITIPLKTRSCSSSSFRLTSFPRRSTRPAAGSIRCWRSRTLIFQQSALSKTVIVLGHVQDEDGQKMSKSKGNAVDPFDALDKHGADAIRWYFYTNGAPWLPKRFSRQGGSGEASASSSARCGIRMHSSCCMPTSTASTRRNIKLDPDEAVRYGQVDPVQA